MYVRNLQSKVYNNLTDFLKLRPNNNSSNNVDRKVILASAIVSAFKIINNNYNFLLKSLLLYSI